MNKVAERDNTLNLKDTSEQDPKELKLEHLMQYNYNAVQ